MREQPAFAVQSLIVTVIFNAALLGIIYMLAGGALTAANSTIPVLIAGVVITLLLWAAIAYLGRRPAAEPVAAGTRRATAEATPRTAPEAPKPTPAERVRPPERARPVEPARTAESGAVQMLAVLQRQGRLIDFLQEDLSMYEDAQIGAAVRPIHEGCRQALAEHVKLEPIFREAEGSAVTVQMGFDTRAIRLTGNVVGEPPFRGELRHRGWRVASMSLPQQLSGPEKQTIVAAAEVEVSA